MTIASLSPFIEYVGDATNTVPIPFEFFDANEILVYHKPSGGAYTLKAYLVDYTITGGVSNTGTLTWVGGAPNTGAGAGVVVALNANKGQNQSAAQTFDDDDIEQGLDRRSLPDLEFDLRLKGSIHIPRYENIDMELPALSSRANKWAAYDSDGKPTALTDTPPVAPGTDYITLVAGQAVYTLTNAAGAINDDGVEVSINGQGLYNASGADEYNLSTVVTENDTITLALTPTAANGGAGLVMKVVKVIGALSTSSIPDGSISNAKIVDNTIVLEDKIDVSGQAVGDLPYVGTGPALAWLPKPGSSVLRQRLVINPVTGAIEWRTGGLLAAFLFPLAISSVSSTTKNFNKDDTRPLASEVEIVFDTDPNNITVLDNYFFTVEGVLNLSAADGVELLICLFNSGFSATEAAQVFPHTGTGKLEAYPFHFRELANGTAERRIRVGYAAASGTSYFNQPPSGGRLYGGSVISNIDIKVYEEDDVNA